MIAPLSSFSNKITKISVIKHDLGPLGGINGGQIIGTGTPENIANNKKSYTGKFLKKIL